MSACIFCQIASGEIPTAFVYQDDQIVVFRDLHPVAPVHVLVVPRHHADDLLELASDPAGPKVMAAILQAMPLIAEKLDIAKSGFRLINNCGRDGGQTIRHVHFHLIGGRALGARVV